MRVEGNEFVVFRVGSLFIRVAILPTKFKDWKDTRENRKDFYKPSNSYSGCGGGHG
jgi:hypothetical protein